MTSLLSSSINHGESGGEGEGELSVRVSRHFRSKLSSSINTNTLMTIRFLPADSLNDNIDNTAVMW